MIITIIIGVLIMKILYAIREDYMEKKGGDTFQMLTTKSYIESLHPDVTITVVKNAAEIDSIDDANCLHIFNMQNSTFAMSCIQSGKRKGLKIALSPVYWDLSDSIYVNRILKVTRNFSIINRMKSIKRLINFNIPSRHYMGIQYKAKYRALLNQIDLLLPNSVEEGEIIFNQFKTKSYDLFTVPNAIEIKKNIKDNENSKYNYLNGCILEVARIEPTKNQLGVLLACMNNNYPIVFVGSVNNSYYYYYEELKRLANIRGNVYFLGEKTQDELADIYTEAKVHVLPSFRESPGLVSLEALWNNCNIVVSNEKYCPISYYKFDKYAYLCDPYNIDSIGNAIEKAKKETLRLKNKSYFDDYSYRKVADCTYNAYKNLLKD